MGDRQVEQQKETETEILETENYPVSLTEFTSTNAWVDYQIDKFLFMAIQQID